jgi:CCR4-NOT transcription complex subunit 4
MNSIQNKPIQNISKKQVFSKEDISRLSKCRIIQKNLVHFYGFPDYLYKKEILVSSEYFGQYGVVSKIVLVSKEDKSNNKNHNSAYITFLTKEQAAYSILAVDSIKINGQLVRAFFGTSKYCSHFLNNRECTCEDNCMFLHHIADKNDIINDDCKFGYSDHIKLAKKIINFGSYHSKYYVKCNKYPFKTFLPSIETIYSKENIIIKTKNHRRNISNSSNKSTSSDDNDNNNNKKTLNEYNNENKIKDILKDKLLLLVNNNIININANNNLNLNIIKHLNNNNFNINDNNISNNIVFKSKNKSRFYNNSYKSIKNNNKLNNDNYKIIIDNILTKYPIYSISSIRNNIIMKKYEYNFCLELYNKTKDIEIIKLIKKIF